MKPDHFLRVHRRTGRGGRILAPFLILFLTATIPCPCVESQGFAGSYPPMTAEHLCDRGCAFPSHDCGPQSTCCCDGCRETTNLTAVPVPFRLNILETVQFSPVKPVLSLPSEERSTEVFSQTSFPLIFPSVGAGHLLPILSSLLL